MDSRLAPYCFAFTLLLAGPALAEDDIWELEPQGNEKTATLKWEPKTEQRARLSTPQQAVLYWLVPSAPVERYTLRYGTSAEELNHSVELETSSLETAIDKVHGKMFRYTVPVETDTSHIFYTLQAHNEEGTSAPTPVQRLSVSKKLLKFKDLDS